MQLAGHRTRSVFDLYNIVSDGDLRTAACQLSGQTGTIQGQLSRIRRQRWDETGLIAE
jgi:hypothetical protein